MKCIKLFGSLIKWTLYALSGLVAATMLLLIVLYMGYLGWRPERLEALEAGSMLAQTESGPIEYVLRGESGPLTLFIHGRPGGYDSAPEEPLHGRLLAPSRPGYLRTPLQVGTTPATQAKAYADLLDALGITEKVIVMGASAGGPSAIEFAARYPERTAALILPEPVSQPRSDGPRPFFLRNDFTVWLLFGAMEFFTGPEGLVQFVVPDPANRARILQDPVRTAEFAEQVWSMWPVSRRNAGWDNDTEQFRDFSLPLENVTAPTLIMHGTADTNAPFGASQHLAQRIPGALLHVVEGADHMMPFTHRDELRKVQQAFLASYQLLPAALQNSGQ